MKKKGTAGMAASLVGLLALLMLMYLFVIPPEFRQALLENNQAPIDGDGIDGNINRPNFGNGVIVSKFIGELDFTADDFVGHFFPSINLIEKKEIEIFSQASSALIRRSIFSNEPRYFTFNLDNPKSVEDIKLGFAISINKGTLNIIFNGQSISVINDGQSKLIDIPPELLSEKNVVEFQVSSPGIFFWSTNEYLIDNFKIIGNVVNSEGLEAHSNFILQKAEFNKLEESALSFYVDCAKVDSPLEIEVNGNNIYSSIPSCGGSLGKIEFEPNFLKENLNKLKFKTKSGNYFIDRIKIRNKLEESDRVIFYFDLTKDELEFILDNAIAIARAEYTDDFEDKDIAVYLNGHLFDLNTRTDFSEYDVTRLLSVGINSVEIVPQKDGINMKKFEIYIANE